MSSSDPRDPEDPKDPEDRDPDSPQANRPGELDHASGEVDEFEAAAASGGIEADEPLTDDDVAETGDSPVATVPGASTKQATGPRFYNFIKACWAELQRVQWPDRRQVGQATAVVIGFVIVAGAFLGVADALAQQLVDIII